MDARPVPCVTRCKVSVEPSFVRNYKDVPTHRVHGNLVARRILVPGVGQSIPGNGPHTLLFAGFNTCPAGQTSHCHWHRFEELWFFASGKGWWREAGAPARQVVGGDFIYCRPDRQHEISADEDLNILCVGSRLIDTPWPSFWSLYFEAADHVTQRPESLDREGVKEVLGLTERSVSQEPSPILSVKDSPQGLYDQSVIERVVMGVGVSGVRGWDGCVDTIHYTYNTLPPGAAMSYHWHYYEELLFIVRGEGMFTDGDGTKRPVIEGDTIYIAPNTPHSLATAGQQVDAISIAVRLPGGRPDTEMRFVEYHPAGS